MSEKELEADLEEEAQVLMEEMEMYEKGSITKRKAKRVILNHNFSNVRNDEWRDRKRRRNTSARGGYRHPVDAALAMVDTYHAANNVTASPKSLAVAAIHGAGILFNGKETQLDLGNQYNVSPSTIRKYHHEMVDSILD